ncbi:MTH1 protein, partial [Acromyrmex insinuator]
MEKEREGERNRCLRPLLAEQESSLFVPHAISGNDTDLRPVSLEKGQETLRLRVYACYAWGGPFLVAGLAALLDHLPPQPQYTFLRPRFGEKQCWFYGDMEILAYFFGPIGVLLAVNLMFFAVTARELTCGLWKGEFVKSTTERNLQENKANSKCCDQGGMNLITFRENCLSEYIHVIQNQPIYRWINEGSSCNLVGLTETAWLGIDQLMVPLNSTKRHSQFSRRSVQSCGQRICLWPAFHARKREATFHNIPNDFGEDEVHCSDLLFAKRRNVSITRTRENRCSNNNSRNIPELCQQPRLRAISDTLRCNDNKRDAVHGRGTPDRFNDCETTLTPWKRSSFISPDETPDLLFFAGIRDFILNFTPKDGAWARLNIKDNWLKKRKDMWRKPRKILGSFKLFISTFVDEYQKQKLSCLLAASYFWETSASL